MKSKTLTLLANVLLWLGLIMGLIVAFVPVQVEGYYSTYTEFSWANFALGIVVAVSAIISWAVFSWMAAMLDNSDSQRILLTSIRDCIKNETVSEEVVNDKNDLNTSEITEEYSWVCQSCKNVNSSENDVCYVCGIRKDY